MKIYITLDITGDGPRVTLQQGEDTRWTVLLGKRQIGESHWTRSEAFNAAITFLMES